MLLYSGSWLPPEQTGLRDQAESLGAFYNLMLNLTIMSTKHTCGVVSPTEIWAGIIQGVKPRKWVASGLF